MDTNVMVVGKGGREDALAWKLSLSERIGKIYIAPGNGSTHRFGGRVPISEMGFEMLATFAKEHNIGLTVVGPDEPIGKGIADYFQERGLKIFSPTRMAARIESSKSFGKIVCLSTGTATAPWRSFDNYDRALEYVRDCTEWPIFVKADGPAFGKGAERCNTQMEAEQVLKEMMLDRVHGDSGETVVIEEFIPGGEELSAHSLTDSVFIKPFPFSRDYKQVWDGGRGDNTGGMGAVVPVEVEQNVRTVINNAVGSAKIFLEDRGTPFVGCMYPNFMLTKDSPKLLEWNARFGDPECQAYMRLLKSDLLDVLEACVDGRLGFINLEWHSGCVICVVLVSGGYPDEYKTGFPISGLEKAERMPGVEIFYAGVERGLKELLTSGGRVLNVTAWGANYREARDRAYEAVQCIHFEGMHYRRDIGAEFI